MTERKTVDPYKFFVKMTTAAKSSQSQIDMVSVGFNAYTKTYIVGLNIFGNLSRKSIVEN